MFELTARSLYEELLQNEQLTTGSFSDHLIGRSKFYIPCIESEPIDIDFLNSVLPEGIKNFNTAGLIIVHILSKQGDKSIRATNLLNSYKSYDEFQQITERNTYREEVIAEVEYKKAKHYQISFWFSLVAIVISICLQMRSYYPAEETPITSIHTSDSTSVK